MYRANVYSGWWKPETMGPARPTVAEAIDDCATAIQGITTRRHLHKWMVISRVGFPEPILPIVVECQDPSADWDTRPIVRVEEC